MPSYPIRLVLDNIRSTANVGSILRTADAFAIECVYAVGYTPFPRQPGLPDNRAPYIAAANTKAIAKTALGAELTMSVTHLPDIEIAIEKLKTDGYQIIVLEQAENSLTLKDFAVTGPTALVLGNEVTGVSPQALAAADTILEIPMLGHKESFGVAVAAGIALYALST